MIKVNWIAYAVALVVPQLLLHTYLFRPTA